MTESNSFQINEESGLVKLAKEAEFNETEILVAKFILNNKAFSGVKSRLVLPLRKFLDSGDNEMFSYMADAQEILGKLIANSIQMGREYAERLGILKERYDQIWDWVYENEKEL